MDKKFVFLQLSSLEKVFLDDCVESKEEVTGVTALGGERVSYQILHTGGLEKTAVQFSVKADSQIKVTVREVGNVPCAMPTFKDACDEYYLRKDPGLYPDVLYPITDGEFEVYQNSCHSLFVTCEIPEGLAAGVYPVEIVFSCGGKDAVKTFAIQVLPCKLPAQTLTYTQWFHSDCIASCYNYEVFSEEHWQMIEKFIEMAARTGINMILTPIVTPPLDTAVGKERPTVQLVHITYLGGAYTFDFTNLKRWIKMCKRHGISQFEMAHMFTQWGTGCTPKIEVETKRGMEKMFGWHVKAEDEKYRVFLKSFLPELVCVLKEEGVYDKTRFHVSDEPNIQTGLDCYKMEYEILTEFIPKEKIMDAMSHYEFCELGLAENPVVITPSVEDFFKKGKTDIWAYTCCLPSSEGYSNRFIAMPSYRNRITGFQLYKYSIEGFLHWGYNFYYSRFSKGKINPLLVTDADESFPSGDSFSVYPGGEGPIESLRSVVFYEGLQDYRACRLLETYIGKAEVDQLISLWEPFTFNQYPKTNEGVLAIRSRINEKLEKVLNQ